MTLSNSVNFSLEGLNITSTEQGVAVITAPGHLDIPAIVPFKAAISHCIDNNNLFIVVDFSGVNFIDSPFVGTLMGSRKLLYQKGGDLALASVGNILQERLSVMGLDRVFHFYANAQAAILDFHSLGSHEHLSFKLPVQHEFVTLMRRFICSVLRQKGFSPKFIFHLETIADELANNAVDYCSPESNTFNLDLSISRKKIVISVKNSHSKMGEKEMNALRTKFQSPSIDENSPRGRGIPLVVMLSNTVNLELSKTETIVQVTKIYEV